ncbi:membrane hypothetical protein [Gammaproteobacteria bacterium]
MSTSEPNDEITTKEVVDMLLAQVEALEDRLARLEEVVGDRRPVAMSQASPSGRAGGMARSRHRRYRTDPFHGLFGYYFVLGILLLAGLGVVLALTSRDSLSLVWWISAAAFTLYQIIFVTLGVLQKDRRTSMNAAIGLMIAILIDIEVFRLLPFPF